MDVLPLHPTTYLPTGLVEGYTSMIWTERFAESGDFELKTPKVLATQALLPEKSLVSLRDTKEVMMVETHTIEVNEAGVPELTITGRSIDTFLENRALIPTVNGDPWVVYRQYKPSEMVSLLLWNHLVNTTGEDPTRAATVIDALTGIPQVVITNSATLTESSKTWLLEQGVAYDILLDFLKISSLGIRAIRPVNSSGYVMTFDTTRTTNRGIITKTLTNNIAQLCFDVYNGTDRTQNQGVVTPIIFHYDSGHIDDPEYLFSSKALKHMAVVTSSAGNFYIWPDVTPPPDQNISGWNRRSLYIDGGSQGNMTYSDFVAALTQKARIELQKYNRAVLFDGAISSVAPYKYGQDYFLGDKVTLLASYGFTASMIVSEYVRTEDAEGDRGYPGLILAV